MKHYKLKKKKILKKYQKIIKDEFKTEETCLSIKKKNRETLNTRNLFLQQ